MTTKEDIISIIEKEIPYVDIKQYSHNIIGLALRNLNDLCGREAVVELVKTTELKNLGWGYILEEEIDKKKEIEKSFYKGISNVINDFAKKQGCPF